MRGRVCPPSRYKPSGRGRRGGRPLRKARREVLPDWRGPNFSYHKLSRAFESEPVCLRGFPIKTIGTRKPRKPPSHLKRRMSELKLRPHKNPFMRQVLERQQQVPGPEDSFAVLRLLCCPSYLRVKRPRRHIEIQTGGPPSSQKGKGARLKGGRYEGQEAKSRQGCRRYTDRSQMERAPRMRAGHGVPCP